MSGGWIGVDLDGTLARYDGYRGEEIGDPVPLMVIRVQQWLRQGKQVKIFTARISHGTDDERAATAWRIVQWCEKHIGQALVVTNVKDHAMIELWDDRAIQVERNTGEPVGDG